MTLDANPPELAATSDEELMARVMQGSEGAFAALVDRYSQRILNTVYRYVGDRARAEDLAQEVFLRVYVHRARYRAGGKFSAWLFTIAVNLAKNEIRSRVRHRGTASLEELQETSGDVELALVDRTRRPDRWAEQAELEAAVSEAVEELPEPYREAVVLRDLDGLSYEEIADILGIPGGTVRSRINRARHLLKKKLLPFLTGE
ncbi:MAG TPA: sigma-70 family RNA polymerase sigma factor [Candidatus Saccharimonadales bacterium]|nr:sigma-70 family RNA polymerase sigma factor [Candidatus Saccharimonadales bacterium]